MLDRFYAIVDDELARAHGWTAVAMARACLDGGAKLLQMRAKPLRAGQLLEICGAVHAEAAASGATLIVNDRADVARMLPGAGVHVGQDDLPPALARRLLGAGATVGFSTHSPDQVSAALLEPITYLAVGPVFGTRTKDTGYDAVGLDLVRCAARASAEAAAERGPAPSVVAIGGITLANARSVIEAGASSVAVISDIFTGGNPTARVRAFLEELRA